MARNFDGTSTDYFTAASAPVSNTAAALTISLFSNLASKGQNRHFFGLYRGSPTFAQRAGFFLGYRDSDNTILANSFSDSFAPSTIAAPSTGSYFHCAGIFTSVSSRKVYLNGTAGTANTTTIANRTVDATHIAGYENDVSIDPSMDGDVAEVGVWDLTLTDAEISSLSKGVCPLLVRPASLIAYYPLINGSGNAVDLIGGATASEFGSSASASHPRIIRPSAQILQFPPAAAGGGVTIPVFNKHYRNQGMM